jgi:hypothetical protein
MSAIDDAHAAFAQLFDDPVMRNGLADHVPLLYADAAAAERRAVLRVTGPYAGPGGRCRSCML